MSMKHYETGKVEEARGPLVVFPSLSRKAIRRWLQRLGFSDFLFVLPALLIYGGVVLYPLTSMFYLSVFSWDGLSPSKTFVGLANYLQLLADPIFFVTLRKALIWIIFGTALGLIVGLGLALLVNQRLRGTTIFRTIYFLPGTVSVIVVGQVWGWIYQGDYGVLNNYLGALGLGSLRQTWLGDPTIT